MTDEKMPIIEEVIEEKPDSIQELRQFLAILEIVSQRNVFRINEFSIIGKFYEEHLKLEKWDPTYEGITNVVNIYDLVSARGGFQINEYEVVSKLYKSLKEKQESLKKTVDNK